MFKARRPGPLVALLALFLSINVTPAAARGVSQALPGVSISPASGPAGTTVQVSVSGFPANARLDLGAGKNGEPLESVLSGQG
jgi:hypothetical protein